MKSSYISFRSLCGHHVKSYVFFTEDDIKSPVLSSRLGPCTACRFTVIKEMKGKHYCTCGTGKVSQLSSSSGWVSAGM